MTQNPYPNPFRPGRGHTGITLTGFDGGQSIKIFTVGGSLVRELNANSSGSTLWDGKNSDGQTVSSGIYFITTDSGVKYKVAVQK